MTGDPIRQFESAFAEYQQAEAARMFWMGRTGLYAVLKALGVGAGDRVGICAYTCVGVVEAVTRLRARPVFIDVDRHLSIVPGSLLRQEAPLQALILQHTFGVPSDVDASLAWAEQTRTPVIEDCCHALGAKWSNRRVGRFGIAAIFSFQWGKPFSAGQGGMVTFNDATLAREVDRLVASEAVSPSSLQSASLAVQRRLYALLVTPRTQRVLKAAYHWACRRGIVAGSELSSSEMFGNNEGFLRRPGRGQARAGLQALRRWPELLEARKRNAARTAEKLAVEGVRLEHPPPPADPMYLRLPVWISRKHALLERATSERIDIAGWYMTPAHPHSGPILSELGYDAASCPVAEQAFAQVVTLPTFPGLQGAQLARTAALLREFA